MAQVTVAQTTVAQIILAQMKQLIWTGLNKFGSNEHDSNDLAQKRRHRRVYSASSSVHFIGSRKEWLVYCVYFFLRNKTVGLKISWLVMFCLYLFSEYLLVLPHDDQITLRSITTTISRMLYLITVTSTIFISVQFNCVCLHGLLFSYFAQNNVGCEAKQQVIEKRIIQKKLLLFFSCL